MEQIIATVTTRGVSDFKLGVELKKSKIFAYLQLGRWGRRGQDNGFKIS